MLTLNLMPSSFTPCFHLYGGVFDLDGDKSRLEYIEKELAKPGAWDHPDKLTPLLQEKSQLDNRVERLENLQTIKRDTDDWLAMAQEDQSSEVLETLNEQLMLLEKRLEQTEVYMTLSEPEDKHSAILEIHPGAGGTEAQDWAEMLLRMYRRWAEQQNYEIEILDYLPGDEAGVKSVTLRIAGDNAYGLLKGEAGIHRLIRISPFDSSGRRHTSFASVDVLPDAGKEIQIEIKDEDLRIETFRSSGPGGQSVNTTSSAVRITHIPTNISVQCQNEKSQFRNKDTAMAILKARLYERELKRLAEEKQALYAGKDAIAWGSQIRTYTLQPYRLVKDHRTNTEIGDVEAVLDGHLETLIREFLLYLHGQRSAKA